MNKALDRAEAVFHRAIHEARGYLELAKTARALGIDDENLRDAAIAALGRFCDNDELIDAMEDADRRERRGA